MSSAAKLEVERDRRSVARCRHWIAELLADEPLELRETVALLASEVLTNALLHARTKITVAVEANADGVRVEVCDASVLVPIRRHLGADASMGRGLLIVEKLASAWGVDPLPAGSGKLVWFEVRRDAKGHDLESRPVHEQVAEHRSEPAKGEMSFRLLRAPVELASRAWAEYGAAMGELRFLDPVGTDASRLLAVLAEAEAAAPGLRVFSLVGEQLLEAAQRRRSTVDLEFEASTRVGEAAGFLTNLLDGIEDTYLREPPLLLSPRPGPQSRALRTWVLGEFVRQSQGLPAAPWVETSTAGGTATES